VIPKSRRLGLGRTAHTGVGAVIWILAVPVLTSAMRPRGSGRALAVSAAIVTMAAAIDVLIALGRAQIGLGFALAPRYTVFNVRLLAAV